ncbi:MAG: hypothetical protein D8M58_10360 [Calditrichaeota bacterium]|nr:MAG: hypothetical protein DWQ03_09735 [Calditrichota bacterium]MBL1205792.1 hypothetical protein [Calditrichota bacterium]NOG45620.1 hypothetical protein [Calditrichota bacterium]
MRPLFFILIIVIFASCVSKSPQSQAQSNTQTSGYDSTLAQKLGADKYGMRQYVMAFLKRGPNRNQDSTQARELQRAHLDNISRLANEGKLSLAGPFMDDGELRGIYIFNVSSIDEAIELTKTDPAIKAGRLVMEMHPWYGSAALMQVNEIHSRLSKENI